MVNQRRMNGRPTWSLQRPGESTETDAEGCTIASQDNASADLRSRRPDTPSFS